MRVILRYEFIPIIILSILLIIIIAFLPSNVLRIVLSVPFIFFFPGYTAIAFLFPKRDSLSNIERITLSIALSIVAVTIIGFILSYSPWGISVYPIMVSITVFIIIASGLAWYRRHKLGESKL